MVIKIEIQYQIQYEKHMTSTQTTQIKNSIIIPVSEITDIAFINVTVKFFSRKSLVIFKKKLRTIDRNFFYTRNE